VGRNDEVAEESDPWTSASAAERTDHHGLEGVIFPPSSSSTWRTCRSLHQLEREHDDLPGKMEYLAKMGRNGITRPFTVLTATTETGAGWESGRRVTVRLLLAAHHLAYQVSCNPPSRWGRGCH